MGQATEVKDGCRVNLNGKGNYVNYVLRCKVLETGAWRNVDVAISGMGSARSDGKRKKREVRLKEEPRRCFLGLGLGVKFARFHTSERE